jgi:hypothetical protein
MSPIGQKDLKEGTLYLEYPVVGPPDQKSEKWSNSQHIVAFSTTYKFNNITLVLKWVFSGLPLEHQILLLNVLEIDLGGCRRKRPITLERW